MGNVNSAAYIFIFPKLFEIHKENYLQLKEKSTTKNIFGCNYVLCFC